MLEVEVWGKSGVNLQTVSLKGGTGDKKDMIDLDSVPNAPPGTEFSVRNCRVLNLSLWVTSGHRGSDDTLFWRQNKTDEVFLFHLWSQSLGLATMDSTELCPSASDVCEA